MLKPFLPNDLKPHRLLKAIFIAPLVLISINCKKLQAAEYNLGPLLTIVELKESQARGTIDIHNTGNETARLRIYVEDFSYDSNVGFTVTSNHPFSAKQYLQFSPRELVIAPKTTRNVRVNLLIPSSAPDGEYRAVVFAEELKDKLKPQKEGAANINTRIGSLFFVSKGNNSSDISATGVSWQPKNKQLQVILANKGSATYNPGLQWKIERDGQEIESGIKSGTIVQNRSERVVNLNVTKADKLLAGEYTISGQVLLKGGDRRAFSFKLMVTN